MRCRKIPDPNISLLWIVVEQRESVEERDGSGDHKPTKLFFVWEMVLKTRQSRKDAENIICRDLNSCQYMKTLILSDYLH